jgi:hypothetical protein
MYVRTNEYEGAHGNKPRGYGMWAFWLGSDTSDIGKAHFITGMYSDAAKQAKAMAREQGFHCVTVGS